MCGKKSMFMELNKSVADNISFGDDSEISVKRRGNILIHTKDGSHKLISYVYHVPDMTCNILSMGQLLKKGYNFYSKNYCLFIKMAKEI